MEGEKSRRPRCRQGAFAHYVQTREADYFTATPVALDIGKPMMKGALVRMAKMP